MLSGDITGLRIQDIGSQSVVPLLDLHAGQTFLDVCAAPGNKTAQALESGVLGIACDLHWHRLQTVNGCARVVIDATSGIPFSSRFDRILVDAPCSGTGTLGRNPEIRWRLRPDDLEELHRKQVQILRNGLACLVRGGRLVYSTCSLVRYWWAGSVTVSRAYASDTVRSPSRWPSFRPARVRCIGIG